MTSHDTRTRPEKLRENWIQRPGKGPARDLRPTVGGERIGTALGNWPPLSPRNSPCVLGMPCMLRCPAQGWQLEGTVLPRGGGAGTPNPLPSGHWAPTVLRQCPVHLLPVFAPKPSLTPHPPQWGHHKKAGDRPCPGKRSTVPSAASPSHLVPTTVRSETSENGNHMPPLPGPLNDISP